MHPSAGGDESRVLALWEVGHEDAGCPIAHDLQEGETFGQGWGGVGVAGNGV